ncbi:DNA polymerase [Streptomyces sp. CA-250714]|uniref:DNA polymerase n=1 Tax=Streptomyces sp. CA-250714 TaxID=3240060 RepID=UPI003D8F5414
MQVYRHVVAGELTHTHVPQDGADLDAFMDWFSHASYRGPIALDTETTGLDIYSPNYRLRTVQFGDRDTAWVIHWERGGDFVESAHCALRNGRRFLIHNAPFDWAVLDRHAGVPLESLAPRTVDTRILAGLVDPRQPQEGGRGTGLKPLSAWYVDPGAPDTQGDLTAVFRSLGLTKATGWAGIPLDHPTYNLYAGLDVILTSRLYPALLAELDMLCVRQRLIDYEHEIARICAVMQRRGMVLDLDYTRQLDADLQREAEHYAEVATTYAVGNVNSNAQLASALRAMGEVIGETAETRTKSGAPKLDKPVLLALADLNKDWKRVGLREPNPLADAVIRSKRAAKWRSAYTSTFLDVADSEGRVHPFINSMQARTARMSITRPALQTLPGDEARIRRCLLAEPGHVIGSTDFQAIEMRVLAALADVRKMKAGFAAGEDIHMFTARLIVGEETTEAHRKQFKTVGLGKIYGGGIPTLARQSGASEEATGRAVRAYDTVYPEIKRMSRRWQRQARETGLVHLSVTGRRLPLDRDRMYAVVNYACQSAARDCLGQSLIHMEEAGLLPYLRLPIHDEVVYSAPQAESMEIAREIERCMTFELHGVPITADSKVGGRSWGSLYGADH